MATKPPEGHLLVGQFHCRLRPVLWLDSDRFTANRIEEEKRAVEADAGLKAWCASIRSSHCSVSRNQKVAGDIWKPESLMSRDRIGCPSVIGHRLGPKMDSLTGSLLSRDDVSWRARRWLGSHRWSDARGAWSAAMLGDGRKMPFTFADDYEIISHTLEKRIIRSSSVSPVLFNIDEN
jgi:hypothetical protein